MPGAASEDQGKRSQKVTSGPHLAGLGALVAAGEASTQEKLRAALSELSVDQLRWVVARLECSTDKEAAERIGVTPATVYRWPASVREAPRLLALDGVLTARQVLRRCVAKAAQVLVATLDDDDPRVRLRAAREILNRELGRPKQTVDVGFTTPIEAHMKVLEKLAAPLDDDDEDDSAAAVS